MAGLGRTVSGSMTMALPRYVGLSVQVSIEDTLLAHTIVARAATKAAIEAVGGCIVCTDVLREVYGYDRYLKWSIELRTKTASIYNPQGSTIV